MSTITAQCSPIHNSPYTLVITSHCLSLFTVSHYSLFITVQLFDTIHCFSLYCIHQHSALHCLHFSNVINTRSPTFPFHIQKSVPIHNIHKTSILERLSSKHVYLHPGPGNFRSTFERSRPPFFIIFCKLAKFLSAHQSEIPTGTVRNNYVFLFSRRSSLQTSINGRSATIVNPKK